MANPYREREYARMAREIAFQLCDRFQEEITSNTCDAWIAWEELRHEVESRFDEACKDANS